MNELASDPLITSVGGTAFDKSAFSGANHTITAHAPEQVWNDANDGAQTSSPGAVAVEPAHFREDRRFNRSHSGGEQARSTGRSADR